MLEGIRSNNSIQGAALGSSFAKQTPLQPFFLMNESLFSKRHVANGVCRLHSARIIEVMMSYVLRFTCLVGSSAVCFTILSPQMFSKRLPPRFVELQEVLVCSLFNRLSLYSDLPLLRPPEKGLQAKTLMHWSACCLPGHYRSRAPQSAFY